MIVIRLRDASILKEQRSGWNALSGCCGLAWSDQDSKAENRVKRFEEYRLEIETETTPTME